MIDVYLAAAIAPMNGLLIRDGFIAVEDGWVVGIGPVAMLPAAAQVRRMPLGQVLITPGLINAHTHMNLTWLAGQITPMPFWDWIIELIRRRRAFLTAGGDDSTAVSAAVRAALARGTTCLADMHDRTAVRGEVGMTGIRQVICGELLTIAGSSPGVDAWGRELTGPTWRGPRSLPALAPHAPYSCDASAYRAAAQLADAYDIPLVTHWAETREEIEFLNGQRAQVESAFGRLDPDLPARLPPSPNMPAIEYAEQLGLLGSGAMLVHAAALDVDDISHLARFAWTAGDEGDGDDPPPEPAVCYCPRASVFLQHGDHPWRTLLGHNINVCIGTDSLASLPAGATVSPLEELWHLRERHPDVSPMTLWMLATTNAARALRLGGKLGVLETEAHADFVTWPLADGDLPDPLASVLDQHTLPNGVWIDGERIVLE